ncbi:MAG: uL15m family ribosomal protein [Nanoarchaeota archaeon]
MKIKRRKKSSRFRGTHTHGRGFKKKARGSGHRGGKGMAGTGKRGDQRKTFILNLPTPYFRKDKALRRKKEIKFKVINILQIIQNLENFIKNKTAEESKDSVKINLKGYKILGEAGKIQKKLIIHASAASKSAIDKIKKSGGEIILEK